MDDGGAAFDAYLMALAASCAADPDNLAKVLEFRRALRAGRPYGGAASVPVLQSEGKFPAQPMGVLPMSVDIILPVHNALEDVQACLESVRRTADRNLRHVWLVDDGSALETAQWLASQQDGLVRAIRTPENLGFTGAVARGFQQTSAELVVVLNSDAVVDDGWLRALIRPFQEDARVALTGPLSNAAAWQSLGRVTNSEGLFATNLTQPGAEMGEINRFLRRHETGGFLDLPIVHGFCFAISRAAYDQVGGFDLQTFGAGYGETQDLCLRLRAAGYRIGVCTDVFVQHGRSRSYSDVQRTTLSNAARRNLYRKHGALNYLRAEADCIDHAQVTQIRAETAGWFAQDALWIQALAEEAPRPAEFHEIAVRQKNRRNGRRFGTSLIGLPRSGDVRVVSLPWRDREPSSQSIETAKSIIATPMPTTAVNAKVIPGCRTLDLALGNVLLVSHEASYTGAPILVQNVARVLSERYNVTVLCIRGGDLLDALVDVSVDVVVAGRYPEPGTSVARFLKRFLSDKKLDFAVVNSIESRCALPILDEIGVSSVSLIHEFASYTRPHSAFSEVADHADDIVFSSPLTLENAIAVTGFEVTPNVHVFPQGKCVVPSATNAQAADESERLRLRTYLRPVGHEEDFLVIGAGHVQIRKGNDLFIEVARQALADSNGRRLRFAWIGAGYDPEQDLGYSVYLQDQLKRSGLTEELLFLPATSEIEYAYELTDLLLLPSRLDPLPNVAIDAMLAGVPVLCFDSATGIADVLRQGGLATECVADYLNTTDMVRKLQALAASDTYYADVAGRIKSHAQASFDMGVYVGRIEALAIASNTRKRSRTTDAEIIAASPLFRANYLLSSGSQGEHGQTLAERYLTSLSKKSLPRRPEPGFNPHVYAQHKIAGSQGGLSVDPYADFLRTGRPAGPWSLPVICESDDSTLTSAASSLRCALHIHAYYTDALGELLTHLQANKSRPALYVSVASEKGATEARAAVDGYEGKCTIRILPNAGRDIGPFLTGFGVELVEGYDIIGHVHTKKSIALADEALVRSWTAFLQENILGGTTGGAMLDRVVNAFAADDGLGVVFPADPYLMSWSRNRVPAARLAESLGLDALPDLFDFPIGTMFWMRSTALRPFVGLKLGWADYPREPVAYDGTVLHALERLFGIAPVQMGHRAAVTHVTGFTR